MNSHNHSRTPVSLARTALAFQLSASVPFFHQIYEGYRSAILSGTLRPGQRLPSTRVLAAQLGISRQPVLNAFEQLLHEGFIVGKVGSGTFVQGEIPGDLSKPTATPPPRPRTRSRSRADGPGILGPFRVSLPALDQFPRRIWGRLLSRHARRLTDDVLAYGDPAGYFPLREQIALYLRTARAVRCEASQVVVVSGSQMALQLCSTALVEAGHAIGMEEPGYPGARDAFRSSRGGLVPIPVDSEGIVVRHLDSRARRISLVYVTPSHQYPLGDSMTVSRRLELLSWAKKHGAWIVEDDYDSEYRYASRPLGSLQGMDTASRVIYVGTFSKVLFPALRIGYLVVPPELVERFVRFRERLDLFSPTINQVVLADFLAEGHFARHVRRMRALYLSRRDALVAALREHLSDRLTIHNTEAGLHLTAFLRDGVDDREVVLAARRRGIGVDPLSACYGGRKKRTGLILGFGGAEVSRIQNAVRRLRNIVPPRR